MALRRGSHSVYDTQYHLVWAPKYRKTILTGVVGERMRELLFEIAESYGIEIDELEVSVDHVHILCSFPPKFSITQVVTRFKSLSARAIFREYPQVKRQLWGGEFWEDGYFARTVGDKVTSEVIKRYIQNHRDDAADDLQLKLFQT
jgi:putative transposase